MRSSWILLLIASLPHAAAAIELDVDESKGACHMSAQVDALQVTCPRASVSAWSMGAVSVEFPAINGVQSIRFNIPVSAGGRVAVSRTASGWSFGEARGGTGSGQQASAGTAPPAPAPSDLRPRVEKREAAPLAGIPKAATAAEANTRAEALAASMKDLQLDFSIPDMPAFTVLGMTPENVTQARTSRALAAAIKNGIDENGKVKSGMALEFQPFRLVNPQALLKSYVLQAVQPGPRPMLSTVPQMLANTSISLGTAKGTDADDKSMRLGLGIRIPIFDKSDGRTDEGLLACYEAVDMEWADPNQRRSKARNEAALKASEECYNNRASARWNASSWVVSLGHAWTSDDGNFSDRKTATRGAWTTYAYGFDGVLFGSSQILFHLRAIDRERVAKPGEAGKFQNQDSRVAGVGFKVGSESFNASLQASYQRLKVEGVEGRDKVRRLALGLEYRVAPDIWLVATVGGEGGRRDGEDRNFVLAGLKFAPSSKPLFSLGQ